MNTPVYTSRFGKENLTLLTDFYELTMANGFFQDGRADQTAYFDMFFRRIPDGGGLAIMAGVAQVIEYLENLSFTEEDIKAGKILDKDSFIGRVVSKGENGRDKNKIFKDKE